MSFAPGDIVRDNRDEQWRVVGWTSRKLVVVESMGGVRLTAILPDRLTKVDQ